MTKPPIFTPDAWRPGPLLLVVVGFLLAVGFVVAVVVDAVGRAS